MWTAVTGRCERDSWTEAEAVWDGEDVSGVKFIGRWMTLILRIAVLFLANSLFCFVKITIWYDG